MCLIEAGQYKYKLNAQYLRLFGLHIDVNDSYSVDANRLQNKTNPVLLPGHQLHLRRCGGQIPCALANEDLGTLAKYDPLTGYEPIDYHVTEATEPYIQESSVENGSPNDLEYDDVTIGKALSSPLFTQEREDDASRRRACDSQDEGLSSCLSSSVMIER